MQKGQLSIHSENILPIIKKWLYSEKDIFVRELAANASDAIQKRRHLESLEGASSHEPRIDIRQDAEKKALIFSDTGIGLNAEEAEKYLAQIAFSGAKEFIATYELEDTFIGHFGLGFFSAFIVADRVDVVSKSFQKDSPSIVWSSDGSTEYTIQKGSKTTVGTDVILYLGKDHEDYLDETKLRGIVRRFCSFFPYPVYLNGTKINEHEPLWQKRPGTCSDKEYQDFYQQLYPFEEPPLFWIHVNVDFPFHVQGILYFPRFRNDMTVSKDHVKLFSNRVFVSDDCKDILPEYLMMLRGVLESSDIPLNVSRSHLQVDSTVRQLASHISKKVVDALTNLFKNDKPRFEECWGACEIVVKLGMLQDEKFYTKAKELLIWKNCQGEWKQLDADKEKPVLYCEAGQEGSSLTKAYLAKEMTVLVASCPLDHPLMSRLEKEDGYQFRRIDALLDDTLLDSTKEKTILDANGRTEGAKIADFFRSALKDSQIDVDAKSIALETLPALLTLEENQRRFRDYMNRMGEVSPQMQPKATLIVNTNSPLVQAAYKAKEIAPEVARDIAQHILELTRISHHELPQNEMHDFIQRTTNLLEKLTAKLT